jgi:hypothetical protein
MPVRNPVFESDFTGGRLTLTSGTPITTADVTGAGAVYYSPLPGLPNRISLYNGSAFQSISFSETNVSVPGTLFRLFDIFGFNNSGNLGLETVNWSQTTGSITGATNASPIVITSTSHGLSNGDLVGIASVGGNTAANGKIWTVAPLPTTNTFGLHGSVGNGAYTSGGTWYKIPNTRSTALTTQNGIYLKSGDTTRRYLGTAMTTGTSGQTEDSLLRRFLWNANNRVVRPMAVSENTSIWSYTGTSYRAANNKIDNRVQAVIGLSVDPVEAELRVTTNCGADNALCSFGVGVSNLQNDATVHKGGRSSTITTQTTSYYQGTPSAGYFYLVWLEMTFTTAITMRSQTANPPLIPGLVAKVLG